MSHSSDLIPLPQEEPTQQALELLPVPITVKQAKRGSPWIRRIVNYMRRQDRLVPYLRTTGVFLFGPERNQSKAWVWVRNNYKPVVRTGGAHKRHRRQLQQVYQRQMATAMTVAYTEYLDELGDQLADVDRKLHRRQRRQRAWRIARYVCLALLAVAAIVAYTYLYLFN